MTTPQHSINLQATDLERAAKIAEAMTANPGSAHLDGRPWTAEEVIGVAIDRGIDTMEQRYLDGRS